LLTPIDPETAAAERWDVVVAGTSFAAMFFARGLPPGTRVLFVEKGERHAHAERIARRAEFGTETIAQENTSGSVKEWIAHSTFGGNSNCWWACSPRFHPDDFRLRTLHGVGQDWPLNYDELEPFYAEAEDVMDINGGGSDAVLPRSRSFPSPEHRPSLSDIELRKFSPLWWAQPSARSSGSRRARCCGNGVCNLCPVDSKFTILNSLDQFERPEFRYLTGWEVRRVGRSGGVATELQARHADGREAVFKGDLFALGANAVFNAAILLRSGFTNPALGGYLHEQASRLVMIDCNIPNYHGGSSVTGHGYHFYHGVDRASAAAVVIENWNSPASIRLEPDKWTHRLAFKLIAEDMPQAENRVVLAKDEPLIHWSGHSPYATAGLDRAIAGLKNIIPVPIEKIQIGVYATTEAHIQGTHRIGATAAEGVVDRDLRTFECPNVLALGAGAYPTCSPANPTLTLSALSLRAGRRI
jgi:choline dehydrogenase-like flavoprotein